MTNPNRQGIIGIDITKPTHITKKNEHEDDNIMTVNEAYEYVCERFSEAVEPMGYHKLSISNAEENEIVSLFANDAIAYSVIYYIDKQRMVLESCQMTDDGPDNEWRSLATWMFDPETNDKKDATSIANDFIATVTAPARVKTQRQAKKKKRDEDGNVDPIFLFKRLVQIFPELKDEIFLEEDSYSPFRSATFARASVVPKVNSLLKSRNKQQITKLGTLLSAQYKNGDMDCRSVITIVILNGIDDEASQKLMDEALDEVLSKAWKFARKFKGKNVKPEKPKKDSKFKKYQQNLMETNGR